MNIDRVYIDIDGVLADFQGGVLNAFGVPHSRPEPGKGLDDYLGLSDGEVWEKIKEKGAAFWLQLQLLPDALDILNCLLAHFTNDQLYLVSCYTDDVNCLVGKASWVKMLFPAMFSRLRFVTDKAELAGPGRLLIDDAANVAERFRAHGGEAILLPRPWNALHAKASPRMTGWLDKELFGLMSLKAPTPQAQKQEQEQAPPADSSADGTLSLFKRMVRARIAHYREVLARRPGGKMASEYEALGALTDSLAMFRNDMGYGNWDACDRLAGLAAMSEVAACDLYEVAADQKGRVGPAA